MFFFRRKSRLAALIRAGRLDKLQRCLSAEHCDQPDHSGHTPLYHAVANRKVEIARYLLALGAQPKNAVSANENVMEVVVKTLNLPLISLFLEYGEALPGTLDGRPLLHALFALPHFAEPHLPWLLEQGIDINAVDPQGLTVLADYVAANPMRPLRVEHQRITWLIAAGADVNAGDVATRQPLYLVLLNAAIPDRPRHPSQSSITDVIDALLAGSPELDPALGWQAEMPSLPLLALQQKKIGALQRLLELGSELSEAHRTRVEELLQKVTFSPEQRQQLAAVLPRYLPSLSLGVGFISQQGVQQQLGQLAPDNPALARLFIDVLLAGKDNYALAQKQKVLHDALAHGFDVNTTCNNAFAHLSLTPLQALVCHYHQVDDAESLVDWLLAQGARVDAAGYSAFQLALWGRHLPLAEKLATQSCTLNYQAANGATVLSWLLMAHPMWKQPINDSLLADLQWLQGCFQRAQQDFPLADSFVLGDIYQPRLTQHYTLLSWGLYFFYSKTAALLQWCLEQGWPLTEQVTHEGQQGNILYWWLLQQPEGEDVSPLLMALGDGLDVDDVAECGDLLALAIRKRFTLSSIACLLGSAEHLQRRFTMPLRDTRLYHSQTLDYLTYALTLSYDDDSRPYCYELCQLLLAHGAVADTFVQYYFKPEYAQERGMYRSQNTALELAAGELLFDVFTLLLDHGAEPHRPMCVHQEYFEHWAVIRLNHLPQQEIIRFLDELDRRQLLQLECRTTRNATPLLMAVSKGQTLLVQYLLDKGADRNAVGGFDDTNAIHRAIGNWNWVDRNTRRRTVELLVDAGTDKDFVDSWDMTPLMSAANFGCVTATDALLAAGADAMYRSENGRTAIHWAIIGNYGYDTYPDDPSAELPNHIDEYLKGQIIERLIQAGADIDAPLVEGETPLMLALDNQRKVLFEQLLHLGADIHRVDNLGRTLLLRALACADDFYLQRLLRHDDIGPLLSQSDRQGNTVLHQVCRRSARDAETLFEQLAVELAVPLTANQQLQTPLHLAAHCGHAGIVRRCLELGAKVDAVDDQGRTALRMALENEADIIADHMLQQLVNPLLLAGANPLLADYQGITPLTLARQQQRLALLPQLVKFNVKETLN